VNGKFWKTFLGKGELAKRFKRYQNSWSMVERYFNRAWIAVRIKVIMYRKTISFTPGFKPGVFDFIAMI
jgi:hypothetical protein